MYLFYPYVEKKFSLMKHSEESKAESFQQWLKGFIYLVDNILGISFTNALYSTIHTITKEMSSIRIEHTT